MKIQIKDSPIQIFNALVWCIENLEEDWKTIYTSTLAEKNSTEWKHWFQLHTINGLRRAAPLKWDIILKEIELDLKFWSNEIEGNFEFSKKINEQKILEFILKFA